MIILQIEMTPELMTAQCFIFFIAGFETSSSTLSYMLLELAQNQHIQDKLRQEIINVLENNDNVLTYDALKEMKYLDMVIAGKRKYSIIKTSYSAIKKKIFFNILNQRRSH